MRNWQPSTLSWSVSKKNHFSDCKRHYFYHRFWGQDEKLRWRLFEMRNLSTLAMLRGLVVHDVIARSLFSAKAHHIVGPDEAKKNITKMLREKYMESAKRLWHIDNRPPKRKASDITSLMEHYYNFDNINERAREAQQIAWQCVENLWRSKYWLDVQKADTNDWVDIENASFPSFDMDGIHIYVKIDFAHKMGANTIVDWKTGKGSEDDIRQLVLYAMYTEKKWGWDMENTRLVNVYLYPELHIEEYKVDSGLVKTTEEWVKASFNEMAELEPAYGRADIDKFPICENEKYCVWCRFQGICPGAKRISPEDRLARL